MSTAVTKIAVLLSGNGSNLQAFLDSTLRDNIALVISNKADAFGLQRAIDANIEHCFIDPKVFENREQFDAAIAEKLNKADIDLVILAGYMRILSDEFVAEFEGRMINIHPSLLPKYPGLNTHQRAIDAGDDTHGCSVHFVTPELDAGPVILQAKVPVFEGDDADELRARIQVQEHLIYPMVAQWFCQNRLSMQDGQAYLDGNVLPDAGYANEE
ncbi:phosphoribosylglycinamide formyltransferase [Alginatibacterium sediminis]|uniref:Phosphoribosylglycinamide formyltransferase n=1 Tax=Alginatibacterium sediminis TaxID=2164068 RepID=A0A420EBI3_9ALTE|nr:phosphoribosylglycinamide formyltransferase [Alginatibacterium sediminis]RKF18035.1 phosphoribosylglycinamide formyltransferase [Alginatibacterium sediminis]